eukprot:gene319-388_t
MPKVVEIKQSHTPGELRRLAALGKNANQSRRLLSIAAVLDGMSRAEAAKIGGMDRQTRRDWAHRFNELGPDGLKDNRRPGNPRRLSKAQQQELAALVETGPDRAVHGVVRWRRVDLQQVIAERYGIDYVYVPGSGTIQNWVNMGRTRRADSTNRVPLYSGGQ